MNKRRTVFKLNKLHKYLKNPGLPRESHHHMSVSIAKNIQEVLKFWILSPLCSLFCLIPVQRAVCGSLCSFQNTPTVMLRVSLCPLCIQSCPHHGLCGHLGYGIRVFLEPNQHVTNAWEVWASWNLTVPSSGTQNTWLKGDP